MSEIKLDVDQASELKAAFRREDYSNEEIKMLCERKGLLADVRRVLRGHATIMVEEHRKGGQWKYDPTQVEFFLANGQKNGKVIEGNKLRKELAKKSCFNANLLDYWLANTHLIPEECKGKATFFWGTVYRDSVGRLYVRCLIWFGSQWHWSCSWLVNDWLDPDPAALRAS